MALKEITFLLAILLITACDDSKVKVTTPNVDVIAGTIERIENFKSSFVESRDIDVWLPPGYDPAQTYQVLYMQDGQNLFDRKVMNLEHAMEVDDVLSTLITDKEIEPVIVVGIWSNPKDRHAEYFPFKPLINIPENFRDDIMKYAKAQNGDFLFSKPICSDDYLKFLVQELKPYIDNNYPTKTDKENTAVMGAGMGALISLYALCEYPDVFGKVACMSPHWPGTYKKGGKNPIPNAFIDYIQRTIPKKDFATFYFDIGTNGLDSQYEETQRTINKVMMDNLYLTDKWKTMRFEDHGHSEYFWNMRMYIPMRFILN